MAVRIRLTRVGAKNNPMYRIVAVDGRSKRDGASLEILGTYDPRAGSLVQFHADRIQYWIGVGAQPSDAVRRLSKIHAKSSVVA
jgi:small subunit ribosomal protein S16